MGIGGNMINLNNPYKSMEPTSGYGAMEDMNKPKRPKQKSCGKGSKCFQKANKRSGMRW
jgi:hypothetical protein